jgi:hypothetical protein
MYAMSPQCINSHGLKHAVHAHTSIKHSRSSITLKESLAAGRLSFREIVGPKRRREANEVELRRTKWGGQRPVPGVALEGCRPSLPLSWIEKEMGGASEMKRTRQSAD